MPVTVVFEDAAVALDGEAHGEELWVDAPALERGLGWTVKPEGACRGPLCIPLSAADRAAIVRADGAVNLAGLARRRGQAVVHDEEGRVWVCGPSDEMRASTARSLEAPDFALPDLEGRVHRLSEWRGRKVLLASWASW